MTTEPRTNEPDSIEEPGRRLHPLSLLFRIGKLVKNLLVPGLLVLWFAKEGSWEIWLMVLFVPSTIYEVVHFLGFRYWIHADRLVVREGLFFREEKLIPFARIQNIDVEQKLLHKPFGVADVRLDTATGSEAEAEFKVLSIDDVESMRTHVFEGRNGRSLLDRPDQISPPFKTETLPEDEE